MTPFGKFCVVTMATLLGSTAVTAEIRLRSGDGSVDIVGDLVRFEDNFFVIQSEMGELRLSADTVACEGADCPAGVELSPYLTVAGSDTLADNLIPLLVEGFAAEADALTESTRASDDAIEYEVEMTGEQGFGDPVGTIRVRSTLSSDGFSNLLGGSAEIGLASRRIRDEESELIQKYFGADMSSPANEHIVAVDSLVVVTHPDNPVSSLTMDQLRAIYGGEITNWSQVGGTNTPITVIQRPAGSGTRSVFTSKVFADSVAGTTARQQIAAGSRDVSDIVTTDPAAIGYVSFAFLRGAKPLSLVNECGLTMTPDAFSARTEEYELNRFLYFYSLDDRSNQLSNDFIDYATSPVADVVVAKSGFIDLGISRQEQDLSSPRARALRVAAPTALEQNTQSEMLTLMNGYDRLSATYRFRTGSAELNPRGLLNVERMVDYLNANPSIQDVVFVGFTDEVGDFGYNLTLADGRANQVMAQVRQRMGARGAGLSYHRL